MIFEFSFDLGFVIENIVRRYLPFFKICIIIIYAYAYNINHIKSVPML